MRPGRLMFCWLLSAHSKRAVCMYVHNAMALNKNCCKEICAALHNRAPSALRQAASCQKLIETDRHRLPACACLHMPMLCMDALHVSQRYPLVSSLCSSSLLFVIAQLESPALGTYTRSPFRCCFVENHTNVLRAHCLAG